MLNKSKEKRFEEFLNTEPEQISKYQTLLMTYNIDNIAIIFLKNLKLDKLIEKINDDILKLNEEQYQEMVKISIIEKKQDKLSNNLPNSIKMSILKHLEKELEKINSKIITLEYQKELFIKYQEMYLKFKKMGMNRIDEILKLNKNNKSSFTYQQLSSYAKNEDKKTNNISFIKR